MTLLVLDASALVEYLLGTPAGGIVDDAISVESSDLHAPALCDVEVASVLRRVLLTREMTPERAVAALDDLRDLPLMRHGHELLLPRLLELRDDFSAYDAAYVALAERLDATLVTADASLARAVRQHLTIEVVEAG